MLNKRADFPILNKLINGKKFTYLDSAATTLKPKKVIETVRSFYEEFGGNIHRGIYWTSEESTKRYEEVREKAAKFINASREEIIFVKNTTEGINLVAQAWGKEHIKKGSKIVSSAMEHHSNLIPWQVLAKEKGAKIIYLDFDKNGRLDISNMEKILKGSTLLTLTHISNVLGTINPVLQIIRKAQKAGVKVLIDGAQAVGHTRVDVKKLGCDFYVFSGHKCLGPSGTGVLWMKKEILERLHPFLRGGGMIRKVTLEEAEYLDGPQKLEAGTPNIEGIIGFGAALDYLEDIGIDRIEGKEKYLIKYCLEKLLEVKNLEIYGPKNIKIRGGIIAFNILGIHPHDLASLLDKEGIAVRAGYHCAMPLHQKLGINGSVRVSLHVYNNKEDIDELIKSLKKSQKLLGVS